MQLLYEASGWAIGTAQWEFVSDFWTELEHVYNETVPNYMNSYVNSAIWIEQQSTSEDPLVTSITSDYDPEAE